MFKIDKVGVPPVKCQGIKTKLLRFILNNINWDSAKSGRWIEPFLGSGVVAFNLAPERALLCDTNSHIINLYRSIQTGKITKETIRKFLAEEGAKLEQQGGDYYYKVRERFNAAGSSYDFLFLNRSCFNGVMRFNRAGGFNVPFCKKPTRFTRSYISKIANQIAWAQDQMRGKDWEFRVSDWRSTLSEAMRQDFVYLDPPYIGRHTDYFNSWDETEAINLAQRTLKLPCGFALSMWLENRYRKNDHIERHWQGTEIKSTRHFYHVGSSETLRNAMDEALVLRAS